MRLLFACGGTAGHINPALAVADLVRQRHPSAEILFVGAHGGMECDLVPRAGYEIKTIHISSLKHSLKPSAIKHNGKVLFAMARSLREARDILKTFMPDAALGTGGYASYPVLREAARMGIPTAVHESNALPGLTTKLLARRADRMLISFEEARRAYRRPERVVLTGTPVRSAFFLTNKAEARAALGLDPGKPVLLSCFGSLGARDMNRFLVDFIAREAKENTFQHIHATGRFGWAWMPGEIEKNAECGMRNVELRPGNTELRIQNTDIRLTEYIYDMPTVMAAADLLITRAGASTLAELMAAGKPAILVPSPNVTGNHQEKNARALSEHGAALLLRESECSGGKLYTQVKQLLTDREQLSRMEKQLRQMAVLDAAEKIYSILMEIKKKP